MDVCFFQYTRRALPTSPSSAPLFRNSEKPFCYTGRSGDVCSDVPLSMYLFVDSVLCLHERSTTQAGAGERDHTGDRNRGIPRKK